MGNTYNAVTVDDPVGARLVHLLIVSRDGSSRNGGGSSSESSKEGRELHNEGKRLVRLVVCCRRLLGWKGGGRSFIAVQATPLWVLALQALKTS